MASDAPTKAKRLTCVACGMSGPSPIVVGKQCANAAACAKRQRKNEQIKAAREKAKP